MLKLEFLISIFGFGLCSLFLYRLHVDSKVNKL
jgi:hypothetical protein